MKKTRTIKKVLIISYYFPPLGMGGVQRTAKFAKYLTRFEWEPIVLTSNPEIYYTFDYKLLDELKNIQIIRTGKSHQPNPKPKEFKFINEPLRKFISGFASIFLIPDTKILWKKKAIGTAEKILKNNDIKLIFATAPPYTDFLIGYHLSKKYHIPLVLDYRDDWLECPYNFYLTPLHKKIHLKLEKKIVSHSSAIITINNEILNLISQRHSELKQKKSYIIPQGFDPEDFSNAKILSEKFRTSKKRMRLCYAGSFLNLMTPEYFLKALKLAFDKYPEMKADLEAYFIGIFPAKFVPVINEFGLNDNIFITGYISHYECIAHLLASDVLWMMIGVSNKSFMISTGKLFEYIGTAKPILASVPECSAKYSLTGYGAEFFTPPDDVNKIAHTIIHLYNLYKQSQLPIANPQFINNFNRIYLTNKLAEIFNSVSSF